jgi:hypothetical protein
MHLVACDKLGNDDMRWTLLVCELPLCVSGLPRVIVGWTIVLWLVGFFLCVDPCVCKVFRPDLPCKLGQFYSS